AIVPSLTNDPEKFSSHKYPYEYWLDQQGTRIVYMARKAWEVGIEAGRISSSPVMQNLSMARWAKFGLSTSTKAHDPRVRRIKVVVEISEGVMVSVLMNLKFEFLMGCFGRTTMAPRLTARPARGHHASGSRSRSGEGKWVVSDEASFISTSDYITNHVMCKAPGW
ncbi:hypothetical protein DM02DRAFT_694705, partial [Periconia macrospinosa]